MTDQPKRRIIPVFDADGRRLFTLQQLAERLGETPEALRQRRRRRHLPDPAGWVDERTAVWHDPEEK